MAAATKTVWMIVMLALASFFEFTLAVHVGEPSQIPEDMIEFPTFSDDDWEDAPMHMPEDAPMHMPEAQATTIQDYKAHKLGTHSQEGQGSLQYWDWDESVRLLLTIPGVDTMDPLQGGDGAFQMFCVGSELDGGCQPFAMHGLINTDLSTKPSPQFTVCCLKEKDILPLAACTDPATSSCVDLYSQPLVYEWNSATTEVEQASDKTFLDLFFKHSFERQSNEEATNTGRYNARFLLGMGEAKQGPSSITDFEKSFESSDFQALIDTDVPRALWDQDFWATRVRPLLEEHLQLVSSKVEVAGLNKVIKDVEREAHGLASWNFFGYPYDFQFHEDVSKAVVHETHKVSVTKCRMLHPLAGLLAKTSIRAKAVEKWILNNLNLVQEEDWFLDQNTVPAISSADPFQGVWYQENGVKYIMMEEGNGRLASIYDGILSAQLILQRQGSDAEIQWPVIPVEVVSVNGGLKTSRPVTQADFQGNNMHFFVEMVNRVQSYNTQAAGVEMKDPWQCPLGIQFVKPSIYAGLQQNPFYMACYFKGKRAAKSVPFRDSTGDAATLPVHGNPNAPHLKGRGRLADLLG